MFSRRNNVSSWRVHHDDTLGRCSSNVDFVDSHAGTSNYPELAASREDLRRDLGLGSDYGGMVRGNEGEEVLWREAGADVDFKVGFL